MNTRIFVTIALCLGLSVAVCAQDAAAVLYQQGMNLYAQKKYLAAVDYLGQVCDMAPANLQARFYLVYSYIGIGKHPEALKHARVLAEKDPGNMSYQTLKAELEKHIGVVQAQAAQSVRPPKEVEFGGYETSEPAVKPGEPKEAPKPKPQPPKEPKEKADPMVEKALEALDNQNYEEAARILEEYLGKKPKDFQALHARGMVAVQAAEYEKARTWLEKALKEKPDAFDTLFLLGEACQRSDKLKEAEEAFAKAVAKKQDQFALINLGEVKKRLGKLTDAVDTLKKALAIDANLVDAKLSLADAYLEQGKTEDAVNLANEVLTSEPGNSTAHFVKGKILYRSDLIDDAITELKAAMIESRENEIIGAYLGRVLLSQQKFAEALDAANEVLKINPNSWEARLILAEALMLSGDNENARDQIVEAEKLYSGPKVMLARARLTRREGDIDKATEMFQAYVTAEGSTAQSL
ncbi:MAG TPA: tetratricopeptide repeat protein, partial [Candidatus Ozemobacteraceae bacterium]|nr:tetratricopeptide repeat protein [Candidatus Ozemobacteraceae bacterium]